MCTLREHDTNSEVKHDAIISQTNVIPFYHETGGSVDKMRATYSEDLNWLETWLTRTSWRSTETHEKSCNCTKKPHATEQADGWPASKKLWRKWPRGLTEKLNVRAVVAKKVNYILGCIIKSEGWSWAHTWRTPCWSPFWVLKYKKENKSKIIRELKHSTSWSSENWLCSPENNLTYLDLL